jgi:hypothetical protein
MNTKTLITLTTFATLNLVFFLSISTIANPGTSFTGDVVKSGVKKQITTTGIPKTNNTITAGNDCNYLRFNVNNYTSETSIVELPAVTDFGYLRFDVNEFIKTSSVDHDLSENEFDYLRFNVRDFSGTTSNDLDELPLN